MAYHMSLYLFVFLPAVLLFYQLAPKKLRWVVLLAAGYGFFWLVSGKLVIFLMGTALFTHYIGIWLGDLKLLCQEELVQESAASGKEIKKQYKRKQKWVLAAGILVLLLVLAYLKYYNFFAENFNEILQALKAPYLFHAKSLLLPIGISFYTLQAIGYMADVYWEKIPPQRNLGKLALFLGFFPQIMEGPISAYSQTGEYLWEGNSLKVENLKTGAMRMLWGLFKKMVIADRLYVLVTAVFGNYESYSGVVIIGAAVAYTVQLYMEFSGCMDLVIGSGRMFGIRLPENFRQPFFSRSAADFWRRWHITLGVWFKTYIFYPVSVSSAVKKWNRFGKKYLGKSLTKLGVSALALFPVWLCNGLWHGPRWSYIFYGMYYFVILLTEIALEPVRNKVLRFCRIRESALYYRTFQILKTWIIIFVGELFFRAEGLRIGIKMFRSIFHEFVLQNLWDGTFLNLGLDKADYFVIGAGCVIAAAVGYIKEKQILEENGVEKLHFTVRWGIYYGLILGIIIFGAYGIGYQKVDLIYAGF